MTQHKTAILQCWLTHDTNVVNDTGTVKGLNKECQEAALVFVFPEALRFFSPTLFLLLLLSAGDSRGLWTFLKGGGLDVGVRCGNMCCGKTNKNLPNWFQRKTGLVRSCLDKTAGRADPHKQVHSAKQDNTELFQALHSKHMVFIFTGKKQNACN